MCNASVDDDAGNEHGREFKVHRPPRASVPRPTKVCSRNTSIWKDWRACKLAVERAPSDRLSSHQLGTRGRTQRETSRPAGIRSIRRFDGRARTGGCNYRKIAGGSGSIGRRALGEGTWSGPQLGRRFDARSLVRLSVPATRSHHVCRPRVDIHRQEVPTLRLPPPQDRERDPFSGNATRCPSRAPTTPITCAPDERHTRPLHNGTDE